MNVRQACDLINHHLIYKPGWRIEASSAENRFNGSVRLFVEFDARNSNSEWAPHFSQEIRPRAEFLLFVEDIAPATGGLSTLFFRIIKLLMVVEEHEAREFLMYHSTGPAGDHSYHPVLHPHIDASMRAWAIESIVHSGLPRTTETINAYMNADRTFGVV